LGISIAKVLRIQSEQIRIKRRQRAEEKAQRAPIKMLIPMTFLIFPTILIIILGPALLVLKQSPVFEVF
jgi:tight adherence protein C